MAIGVGTCAGPVLGSLINRFLGYSMTFACFSALIFISFLIAIIFIPSKLNYLDETTGDQKIGENKSVSYT